MTEIKFIALRHIAINIVWIKKFINQRGLEIVKEVILHSDNMISIALIKNVESQNQTKYMNIHNYYIKKLVIERKLI